MNEEFKQLPNGQRQLPGIEQHTQALSLPKMTVEMLKRLAKQENKTVSAYANYLIWCGYHALNGTFIPPERQRKK